MTYFCEYFDGDNDKMDNGWFNGIIMTRIEWEYHSNILEYDGIYVHTTFWCTNVAMKNHDVDR